MTCTKCQHSTIEKFGRYCRQRVQRYRCISCSTTFSDPKPVSFLGTMRTSEEKAIRAIQCLIEGCSIRSTERMTGLHRDTIKQLLVLAGERCAKLMDERMRGLKCNFVQCDEIWTFALKNNAMSASKPLKNLEIMARMTTLQNIPNPNHRGYIQGQAGRTGR